MAPLASTVAGSPSAATDERRAGRYRARHWLWDNSTNKRVKACGRNRRGNAAGVEVRVTTGPDGSRSAGYAGLQHCGSVWGCPCCSAKIAAGRQDELMRALTVAHERGWRVAFGTVTASHSYGMRLAPMWDDLAYAWQAVTSGAGWETDQLLYGIPTERVVKTGKRAGQTVIANRVRYVRVTEGTYGSPWLTDGAGRTGSGWHLHYHFLLFLPAGTTDEHVTALGESMGRRWRAALKRRGRHASVARGLDLALIKGDPSAALSDYFTKAVFTAATEATRGDLKRSRAGYSCTPFDLLDRLVHAELPADLGPDEALACFDDWRHAWAEWETASKGRRQLTWSPGLRSDLLPDEEELDDEDLADAEVDGTTEAVLDEDTWRQVVEDRADLAVLAAFVRSRSEGLAVLEHYAGRAGRTLTVPRPPG